MEEDDTINSWEPIKNIYRKNIDLIEEYWQSTRASQPYQLKGKNISNWSRKIREPARTGQSEPTYKKGFWYDWYNWSSWEWGDNWLDMDNQSEFMQKGLDMIIQMGRLVDLECPERPQRNVYYDKSNLCYSYWAVYRNQLSRWARYVLRFWHDLTYQTKFWMVNTWWNGLWRRVLLDRITWEYMCRFARLLTW